MIPLIKINGIFSDKEKVAVLYNSVTAHPKPNKNINPEPISTINFIPLMTVIKCYLLSLVDYDT